MFCNETVLRHAQDVRPVSQMHKCNLCQPLIQASYKRKSLWSNSGSLAHKALACRVWRVGIFNFGTGMDQVLEKIFRDGSGTDWVRVLVSNIESIGYYWVMKILIGYLSVSPLFPIFSFGISIYSQTCLWWNDFDLHWLQRELFTP